MDTNTNTNTNTPNDNQPVDMQPEGDERRGSMRNKILIGVGIGLVIVLGIWLLTGGGNNNGQVAEEEEVEMEEGSMPEVSAGVGTPVTIVTPASGEFVSVSDQGAGESVLVDAAVVTAPSWVVVREEGWILGARRVEESGSAISVPLLRATEAEKQYEVVIYIDNGDRQFDHLSDMLVEGISASFTAL